VGHPEEKVFPEAVVIPSGECQKEY